jgi:crossover junction endodeoxyribonuclease RuvC
MAIIGVDPSFSGSGITVIQDNNYEYFLIKAEKQSRSSIDITHRIMKIKKEIKLIINKYRPTYISMEGPSYASQSSSVVQMGALNHMLRELFIEENIKFVIAPPTVIKKYATGKGNADKLMMIEEAAKRGANIPFFKKIQKQLVFDDNVCDSYFMASFMRDYLTGNCVDFEDKIEKSWEL